MNGLRLYSIIALFMVKEETNSNNKRIAKNTLILYLRMVLIMAVQLYVSRVVLNALGVDDYGLFSVVGSVVTFLGFLNTSMAAASQRFLAYAKGRGDEDTLNVTFNSIIIVQCIIAFVVFSLCETIGLFYINNYLNVAPEKIAAAHIVFQFSIATFLVNAITVPYNASIIANERMDVFALLSIVDAFLKLGLAFSLPLFANNRLVVYAALMFGCVSVIQLCYRVYCRRHFAECEIRRNADKKIIMDILSYSGWNLLGSFSSVALNQGVNMILNSFFGVVVNAARGIAFQVSASMAQLYSNFQQALNPQIVKSYAAKEYERMYALITQGTRLSFFLLFMFALPIMFNMGEILKLWLGNVPDYTEWFCVLVICNSLISTMSQSLLMGAMATGNIKKYQIIVAGINLMNLPLSIIGLYIFPDPYLTTYIMIVLSCIAFSARLILVHQMIGLSISTFLNKAVRPILVSVVICFACCYLANQFIPSWDSFFCVLLKLALFFAICISGIAVLGVSHHERLMVITYIRSKIKK